MTWNYRAVRHIAADGEPYLALHEAHYEKKGDRIPYSVSEAPVCFVDEGAVEDLVHRLEMAIKSLKRFPEVVDYSLFVDNAATDGLQEHPEA